MAQELGIAGAPRPLVVSSVHMAVRDQLRNDILTGTFPGGSRLHQTELARYYGVSITPVREALRDLASEGLVDFGPFSGAVVHMATVAELRYVYEIRAHLYPLAVTSAVERITAEELEAAEEVVHVMADGLTPEAWVVHNRRFHRILDRAVENTHLTGVLHRLADLSALYVHISDRDDARRPVAHREHEELVAAYRRRDAARATELTISHITQTLEHATRLLEAREGRAGSPAPDPRGVESREARDDHD